MSNEDFEALFPVRVLMEDEAFLRELIRDLNRYLRRRADQVVAEEALSEALIVLWRKRGELPDESDALRAFAYGVARKTLLAARRAQITAQTRRPVEDGDARVASPQEAADIQMDVARVLDALTERDRELLLLIAWEGLTLAAAANVLGISHAAARQRYSRARCHIRDRITATNNDIDARRAGVGWVGDLS